MDESDFIKLKQTVLSLETKVNFLSSIMEDIKAIPLSSFAKTIDQSRQTIKYHLDANYLEGKDFYKQDGKIYISVGILPNIKAHYGK